MAEGTQLLEMGNLSDLIKVHMGTDAQLICEAAPLLRAVETCAGRFSKAPFLFVLAVDGGENRSETSPNTDAGDAIRLDRIFDKIRQLPQTVVGMVGAKRVSSAGLCILAACDVVIAMQSTEFVLVEQCSSECSTVPAFLLKSLGCDRC